MNDAGAPLIVQQASLAQNVKAYARGAHSLPLQIKVANIVSGNLKKWHEDVAIKEPPNGDVKRTRIASPPPSTSQDNDRENVSPNITVTGNQGQLTINIEKKDAKFYFHYVLWTFFVTNLLC